jgi:hypothetical protein
MANTHLPLKIAHISCAKDIAYKAIATMDMNALSLSSCNTRCILAAMLKQ